MRRRTFLHCGVTAAFAAAAGRSLCGWAAREIAFDTPTYSVIPVVGDGRWIWNRPPEGKTGYLEPRTFEVTIGIELQGRGEATEIRATTPLPIDCPEQSLDPPRVESPSCEADLRQLSPSARELAVYVPVLEPGQSVRASVTVRATLCKQFWAYDRDQFAEKQVVPADVRRQFLGDSPGIETHAAQVRALAKELSAGLTHPWDLARSFAAWVPKNIRPRLGPYTNVVTALEKRVGDCEEMSAVFVALCRAVNIPARLVWVPNHNWSEIYLVDRDGRAHWIPVHTACYPWFGWTGAHELVLQKGDRVASPDRRKPRRLLEDWMQWTGTRPQVRYRAELVPLPPTSGSDAGPGARHKIETGEWKLVGQHPDDKYLRR